MATLRNFRQNARGFTLAEIMVTLVIFSIVMAVCFPMLAKSNRNHRLLGAASKIEAALTNARSTALTQQTPVRVSFSAETNTLLVTQDTNRDGRFDTLMRAINIDSVVLFTIITFDGGSTVTFDQLGVPDNPGTVLLGNGGDIGQQVLVAAGSGEVSVTAVTMNPESSASY